MKTAFDVFFFFAMFVLVPAAFFLRPWYEQAVEAAHHGTVYVNDPFPNGEPIRAPRQLPPVEVVGRLTQLPAGWYLNLGEDEHGSSIMMKLEVMTKDEKTAERLEYKQVRLTVRPPEGRKISAIVEKIEEVKP